MERPSPIEGIEEIERIAEEEELTIAETIELVRAYIKAEYGTV
jgi:hypothetical protein